MLPEKTISTFRAWAPPQSPWSAWAKPVLFTYSQQMPSYFNPNEPFNLDSVPEGNRESCVVIDLPGAQSVSCALALARKGYQPVPLYNATTGAGRELVDVDAIIAGLYEGADILRSLGHNPDAAPAFMLDSARLHGFPMPETYDNRWMVFPQDLPSSQTLRARGINRVLVIRGESSMKHDLRSVLRLWKRDGLEIAACDAARGDVSPLSFDLSIFAVMAAQLGLLFHGLRVNSTGGFGAHIPTPQQSSGYGGYG